MRPLAERLVSAGLKVWYDDFSLKVGDSLRRSLDEGLSKSRFGVVILSPSFFKKEWPQKELDGLGNARCPAVVQAVGAEDQTTRRRLVQEETKR